MPFKLLIIDDDKQLMAMLYDFLSNLKYDVVSAFDGLEGLKLLETEKQGFDLVITDLVMPKISGNYLILTIKQKFPDTPVIAITGWGAYPEAFAIETQADKVLEKPFELSELDKAIKDLLSPKMTFAG
ncbi:MAG: response regulator [Pseudomonadota bacterium]|uniref:Response regulator n=1 Tax=Candidatus Desulfatibia profunda TaxID=2841695 RepID=A0A8J6NSV6_9BACT|nr:response regulator [Candidatus Desulfatibia profunda]MBL7178666.1 response regulator [Desulfobacterales bacterium]